MAQFVVSLGKWCGVVALVVIAASGCEKPADTVPGTVTDPSAVVLR